jgi:predicted dehydrogenase
LIFSLKGEGLNMQSDRRSFLKGTAWMTALASIAGCRHFKGFDKGSTMLGAAVPAMKLPIKVGIVGIGQRGRSAVKRLASIPALKVAALCDYYEDRVAEGQSILSESKYEKAAGFFGPDGFDRMLDTDIDVVYNVTPWSLHAPFAVKAMEKGKHVFIEVPAAVSVEECWALVETSERTGKLCMQLENCVYGEAEMLCLNLVRKGLLGDLVHAEGAYIHDLRELCYQDMKDGGYADFWRLKFNTKHKGNQYQTHGLVPLCQYMNINRGDKFDYLVSLESDQCSFEKYAKNTFPGTWKSRLKVDMGDMNTTLIKTSKGRSIMVQHDVSSPRPYSRLNTCQGTEGIFTGIFFPRNEKAQYSYRTENLVRFAWKGPNEHIGQFFSYGRMSRHRNEYKHPLWVTAGEAAKFIGGHGGMDFLMDLRWAYCLQNGLPLDMDVYDLASTCSIGELTERSVRSGGEPQKVPDFTRGAWKQAKPLGIVDVDLKKLGLDVNRLQKDNNALSV